MLDIGRARAVAAQQLHSWSMTSNSDNELQPSVHADGPTNVKHPRPSPRRDNILPFP